MAERLRDPGFDHWDSATDATYWTEAVGGTSTVNRESSIKRTGRFSCRLDIDAGNNIAYESEMVYLAAKRRYKIVIWYCMSDIGKTAFLMLRDSTNTVYLQADGTWGAYYEIPLANSLKWRKYEIKFRANSAYDYYQIIASRLSAASASIYIDSVSLMSDDKCGFMYDNLWDLEMLTVSTEESYFPAENTRHRWHGKTWRSTGLGAPDWLKLDSAGEFPADITIIKNNNLTTGATVLTEANAVDAWGAPSYTENLAGDEDIRARLEPASINYRWRRIAITDAGNPDGYYEAGRIFIGPVFEPRRNFWPGGGFRGKIDPSIIDESDGGQASAILREKFRPGEFLFDLLPSWEKDNFEAMFEAVGCAKQFFFCQDLGDPWGDMHYVQIMEWEVIPRGNEIYGVRMVLKEAR